MSTNPKTEPAVQDDMATEVARLMDAMGVPAAEYTNGELKSYSPINGQEIGSVQLTSAKSRRADRQSEGVCAGGNTCTAWRTGARG